MGRVYLCLGKSAEVPYFFERARTHIWNVEELCYFVKENAWVLDPEVLKSGLTEWLETQCMLPELSQKLSLALQGPNPVPEFVRTLFSYTGYFPPQDAAQVEKILEINANSSEVERVKARGDAFLQSGRYAAALREYETLTDGLTGADPAFLGKVYHNRGVAQAQLFFFDEAAGSFERAWRLTRSQDSAKQYLIAKRFALGEKEYVNFLADKPDLYAASLKLEEAMQRCNAAWEDSGEAAFLERMEQACQNGAAHIGRQMAKEKVEKLKEAYRNCVDA